MLKLDLKEAESGGALVLAAVVANQVAEDIGLQACIQGIGPASLTLALENASERHRDVCLAHLVAQLGEGFLVELAVETGLVTVSLDMVEEGVEKPDQGDGAAPVKRGRGRPPGSRNRPAEPPAEPPAE